MIANPYYGELNPNSVIGFGTWLYNV